MPTPPPRPRPLPFSVPESALTETFIHATGPGGQNVNKVATAVQLRCDINQLLKLSEAARQRLKQLAGQRLTAGGELILTARRHRTQGANRAEARTRLYALLAAALAVPKTRRATKPTYAATRKRLTAKSTTSQRKATRKKVVPQSD